MKKASGLSVLLQYIRSLLFVIVCVVFTIFYSSLCLLSFPFPLRYRSRMVLAWTSSVVWLAKNICGLHYHVEGKKNISHDRTGIVVLSKHQSVWETFYLPTLFTETAIILKRALLWIPFFGWALALCKPIGIDRNNRASAMSQVMTIGKACLRAGRTVLIFPEGTRIASGEIGKYRLGGARLAVEAGCPVLPVAHNAGRFWPSGSLAPHPGTVHVVFGPLIETKGKTAEEVMALVKDWIEDVMVRIDSPS